MVQIGSAYWLRVPVGKLHRDRYIPLHPQLKALLDEWLAHRSEALRTNYLFTDHGRRVTVWRVDGAVKKAAQRAGLGRVVTLRLILHQGFTAKVHHDFTAKVRQVK